MSKHRDTKSLIRRESQRNERKTRTFRRSAEYSRERRGGDSVRLTARGYGLSLACCVLVVTGWRLGASELIGIGIAGLATVVAASFLLAHSAKVPNSKVHREAPNRLVCGQQAPIAVTITDTQLNAFASPKKLSDITSSALNASGQIVRATPKSLTDEYQGLRLTYQAQPTQIGFNLLGPVRGVFVDPFGVVQITRLIGETTTIVSWPRLTALPVAGAFSISPSGFSGMLSAAPDDATLREYSPGDDLRRIHWPTTARRGIPMIRENESRGVNPVQIYLDPQLLADEATREWTLEHGASVACALLDAGHPVRFFGLAKQEYIECQTTGREELLNQVAELASIPNDITMISSRLANVKRGTITYAILSPKHTLPANMTAGSCYGIVLGQHQSAQTSVMRLRAAGWRVIHLPSPTSHQAAWASLIGAAAGQAIASVKEQVAA